MKGTVGPASVAFVWHMHQPGYVDPQSDVPILPWARLHATAAYFDMAWLHAQHPNMRSTVNFVPVLIDQLEACVAGTRDRFWDLSRKPARDLDAQERAAIKAHFFSVHRERGVRARPRYWSLLNRREKAFNDADFRDLQVLFNLAWFGAAARVEYPLIAQMEAKGRGFREDEKRKILDLQIAILRRVLDLYRDLAATGQIELTCSPYHHPILPLLIDSEAMARCMPDAPQPPRFAFPEDAVAQVANGRARHAQTFGAAPEGMWPAEGAVSPEACAIMAGQGARWIATDEAQLFEVLPAKAQRRELYQPYALQTAEGPLTVIFRDRALSDLLGFTYAQNPAKAAAADLVGRLKAIAGDAGDGALITIALDGENPWEAYVGHGAPFLVALFDAIEAAPTLRATTVQAHLAQHPPRKTLKTIGTGSWIHGDFSIWIGKPVENTAWGLLGEARRAAEGAEPAARAAALEHLYAAEGSDWFWWYGEPFQSEQDAEFDRLFRARLKAAYIALGQVPPSVLDRPLATRSGVEASPPRQLIAPQFAPGPSTYYEWSGAGALPLAEAGAMHQAQPTFHRLRYGFDAETVYLRLEPAPDADLTVRVRVRLGAWAIDVEPGQPAMLGETPLRTKQHAGVLEIGVPIAAVGGAPGGELPLVIEVLRGGLCVARYPTAGELTLEAPSADFALGQWSA